MKRTFITLLLAGSGSLLWAQQTGTDSTTGTTGDPAKNTMRETKDKKWDKATSSDGSTQQSTGNYNAYGAAVPSNVQHSFSQEVPTSSNAQWEPSNEYWRVSYVDNNGKKMRRYYSANGQSFAISLPIMSSYVPENVMAKVQDLYGDKVYDVTMMRSTTQNQGGDMMQSGANAAWSNNGTASMNTNTSVNANSSVNSNTSVSAGNTTVNNNTSTSMSNNGTTTTNSGTTMNTSTDVNGTTINGGTTANADPSVGAHYHVRIIENGTVRSEMINEDGSAYVAPMVTDSLGNTQQSSGQGVNSNQQWNNNTQGTMNTQGTQNNTNTQQSNTTTTDSTGTGTGTTTTDSTSTNNNNSQMLNNQSGTTTGSSINNTTGTNTTTTGNTTNANGTINATNSSSTTNNNTDSSVNSAGTTTNTTDSMNTKSTKKSKKKVQQ